MLRHVTQEKKLIKLCIACVRCSVCIKDNNISCPKKNKVLPKWKSSFSMNRPVIIKWLLLEDNIFADIVINDDI